LDSGIDNVQKYGKIILAGMILALLLFSATASASITQSNPSPADDATDVYVRTSEWNVTLVSGNFSVFNGTMTISTGGTLLSTTTLTNAVNGSSVLTIPEASLPLEASTVYQVWVNVSDEATWEGSWSNTSYNFTTGTAARLSDNSGFSAQQILLIAVLGIVICLVVVVMVVEMADGKPDPKRLLSLILAVIILAVAMGFI